jgi:hypothetical protein
MARSRLTPRGALAGACRGAVGTAFSRAGQAPAGAGLQTVTGDPMTTIEGVRLVGRDRDPALCIGCRRACPLGRVSERRPVLVARPASSA